MKIFNSVEILRPRLEQEGKTKGKKESRVYLDLQPLSSVEKPASELWRLWINPDQPARSQTRNP